MASLVEKLKANKEWRNSAIFDEEANVLASTFAVDSDEIKSRIQMLSPHTPRVLLSAFEDRDVTVGSGLTLDGLHYDVHRSQYRQCFSPSRWYKDEGLIYGRRGDANVGEGICLHRVIPPPPPFPPLPPFRIK
jgi:hypothetical protein